MSFLNDADDEQCMRLALAQAKAAADAGEVPIAAVLKIGETLFTGHNRTIMDCDPSAHAEIVVLRQAGQMVRNHRFPEATLYVTLEPCAMCFGALMQARIKRLVFAAHDKRFGVCGSCIDLGQYGAFNHRLQAVHSGLLAQESVQLLQDFFRRRRSASKPSSFSTDKGAQHESNGY